MLRAMIVFAIVPMLIGVAASQLSREVRTSSLLAIVASAVFVLVATHVGDADLAIGWVASLLVLPLPVACAMATVAFFAGRGERHRHRENGAS